MLCRKWLTFDKLFKMNIVRPIRVWKKGSAKNSSSYFSEQVIQVSLKHIWAGTLHRPKAGMALHTVTTTMEESGLHCRSMFVPCFSNDSWDLLWHVIGRGGCGQSEVGFGCRQTPAIDTLWHSLSMSVKQSALNVTIEPSRTHNTEAHTLLETNCQSILH